MPLQGTACSRFDCYDTDINYLVFAFCRLARNTDLVFICSPGRYISIRLWDSLNIWFAYFGCLSISVPGGAWKRYFYGPDIFLIRWWSVSLLCGHCLISYITVFDFGTLCSIFKVTCCCWPWCCCDVRV